MAREIWAMSPGHAGMENQALGLAEAIALRIGAVVSARRVPVGLPWRILPGDVWPFPLRAPDAAALSKPWPDLVITCGRQAAPIGAAMRRQGAGRVRAVHVQNPLMRLGAFDVVVAPEHDGIAGRNVVTTMAALHRMSAARLAAGRLAWAARLVVPGRRLVSVLIGAPGATGGADDQARLIGQLGRLAKDSTLRLALTPSRRTPAHAIDALRRELAGSDAFLWDGSGDNPYAGLLGCADALIVTGDSVSMMSEALAVGRPVLIASFGDSSGRLSTFRRRLIEKGLARAFDGTLPDPSGGAPRQPLDDTATAARAVLQRLGWHDSERDAA